jgi:hypothetical protein
VKKTPSSSKNSPVFENNNSSGKFQKNKRQGKETLALSVEYCL